MTAKTKESVRDRIVQLHNQGLSNVVIAERLAVHFTTVAKILKERKNELGK